MKKTLLSLALIGALGCAMSTRADDGETGNGNRQAAGSDNSSGEDFYAWLAKYFGF